MIINLGRLIILLSQRTFVKRTIILWKLRSGTAYRTMWNNMRYETHSRKDERAHFAKWRRDAIDRDGEAEASASAPAYQIAGDVLHPSIRA